MHHAQRVDAQVNMSSIAGGIAPCSGPERTCGGGGSLLVAAGAVRAALAAALFGAVAPVPAQQEG